MVQKVPKYNFVHFDTVHERDRWMGRGMGRAVQRVARPKLTSDGRQIPCFYRASAYWHAIL